MPSYLCQTLLPSPREAILGRGEAVAIKVGSPDPGAPTMPCAHLCVFVSGLLGASGCQRPQTGLATCLCMHKDMPKHTSLP